MTHIVVDNSTDNIRIDLFYTKMSTSKKMYFLGARHIDASNVVWTLIHNGKLANRIARLAAIVAKYFIASRSHTITLRRLHGQCYIARLPDSRSVGHIIINGGKKLKRPVSIKK